MKKQFLCLFLSIILLGINSCTSLNSETKTRDLLVYSIENYPEERMLFFYDPINNLHKQILIDWDIQEFSLSKNHRLAFSSLKDGRSQTYVSDYPFTENTPMEISLDIFFESAPLSWSPDGRYLLLDSVQENSKKLYMWNGKNIFDVYEYRGQISEITWSSSGQLAFTEFYFEDYSPDKDYSEIYIWDGNSTHNASQNPFGEDRSPTWSQNGQLAFLSNRNGEYDVFVWDGISKSNDKPDINTFVNIAPNLTQYFSYPVWTSSGSLSFGAISTKDTHVQIYEWDGETANNLSKNPMFNNGGQTWRSDGYWSFVTYFTDAQIIYIRDNTNRTVVTAKGQYPPAWGQQGLLAFCVWDYPDWKLSIWDGLEINEIAYGKFIKAMWDNGEYILCSNG
jgi:hypothetical protein